MNARSKWQQCGTKLQCKVFLWIWYQQKISVIQQWINDFIGEGVPTPEGDALAYYFGITFAENSGGAARPPRSATAIKDRTQQMQITIKNDFLFAVSAQNMCNGVPDGSLIEWSCRYFTFCKNGRAVETDCSLTGQVFNYDIRGCAK